MSSYPDAPTGQAIGQKMALRIAGGLDWMTFKGPFQHKPFYDSNVFASSFHKNIVNAPNKLSRAWELFLETLMLFLSSC